MSLYKNKRELLRKELKKVEYDGGAYYYKVCFIYSIDIELFGKHYIDEEQIYDDIRFGSEESAREYMMHAEKECIYDQVLFNGDVRGFERRNEFIIFIKEMDDLCDLIGISTNKKVNASNSYGYEIPIIIRETLYGEVQYNLIYEGTRISNKHYHRTIGELIDEIKDTYHYTVTTIDTVDEAPHIELPEIEQIKNARAEVIDKELERIEEYKKTLLALKK